MYNFFIIIKILSITSVAMNFQLLTVVACITSEGFCLPDMRGRNTLRSSYRGFVKLKFLI